jgi:hypothetical protein
MPISTRQRPGHQSRLAIDALWEKLVGAQNRLSELDEVEYKDPHLGGVKCIIFDFDVLLESDDINLSLEPPVLFRPLSQSALERYPVDHERAQTVCRMLPVQAGFRDYSPPTDAEEDDNHRHRKCAMGVYGYLDAYAGREFPRTGIPAPHMDLRGLLGLRPIRFSCSHHLLKKKQILMSPKLPESFYAWWIAFRFP